MIRKISAISLCQPKWPKSSYKGLNKENKKIFERNINLIRLVDFSNDMSPLEIFDPVADFEQLKEIFTNLEFSSIVKEKTWKTLHTLRGKTSRPRHTTPRRNAVFPLNLMRTAGFTV